MVDAIKGLHHVTAIAGPAQRTLDFHTGPMGRRLVKTTVNFDNPSVYHLYYGDDGGTPGTILTVFPFEDAAPGRNGVGMASALAYATDGDAVDRAADRGEVRPFERLGERGVALADPDGLVLELIDAGGGGLAAAPFHSVTLTVAEAGPTARLLSETFGYEEVGAEDEAGGLRRRFAAPGDAPGRLVDVFEPAVGEGGRQGAGSIHHVAFRAADDDELEAWRGRIGAAGLSPTPIIDRQYFHSIYFREPGGVLFEIATDPPGFAVDEPQDQLGSTLKLPPQYEGRRQEIEANLPPLER